MKKRILISIVLVVFYGNSFAQNPALDRIEQLIRKHNLAKAHETLLVMKKRCATSEPRAYYLEACLNKELFLIHFGSWRDSLRENVMSNVLKCARSDSSGEYSRRCNRLYNFVMTNIFHDAMVYFNNQKYKKALHYLTYFTSQQKKLGGFPMDAWFYIGSSYFHLNRPDSAIIIFEFLRQHEYKPSRLYHELAQAYLANNQPAKSYELIREARILYPYESQIEFAELKALQREEHVSLELRMDSFLLRYPNNIEVKLMAAHLLEQKKQCNEPSDSIVDSGIVQSYQHVLRLDPSNSEANYHLGIFYYQQALAQMNSRSFDWDVITSARPPEKSRDLFKTARFFLMKTFDPKQPDMELLKTLQVIYYNLNRRQEWSNVTEMIARVRR